MFSYDEGISIIILSYAFDGLNVEELYQKDIFLHKKFRIVALFSIQIWIFQHNAIFFNCMVWFWNNFMWWIQKMMHGKFIAQNSLIDFLLNILMNPFCGTLHQLMCKTLKIGDILEYTYVIRRYGKYMYLVPCAMRK